MQQLIRWTGSKRSQCSEIVKYICCDYNTYYEPFCGSCAVGFYLMKYKPMHFKKFVFSDVNADLINTYNIIKNEPLKLCKIYSELWNNLNKDNNIDRKKEYYNSIRDEVNKNHDPFLFFFITRTCQNGLIRYNSKGEFNTGFHIQRKGIIPEKIYSIVQQYSKLLNNHDCSFMHLDYTENNYTENDLVYLDPPYFNTKGIYFGIIDFNNFFDFLQNLKSDFLLSFDGISDKDNTVQIPKVYNKHVYLYSGKSSFYRLSKSKKDVEVYESLYIKVKNNLTELTGLTGLTGLTEW